MNLIRLASALVAVALLILAGCKSAEELEKEKKAIEAEHTALKGKWTFDTGDGSGADPDGSEDGEAKPVSTKGLVYNFNGETLTEEFGGKVQHYYKVTVRPGTDPKQIDLVETDENGKPIKIKRYKIVKGKRKESSVELKRVGVYKIQGDTLTINQSWDEKDRPTGFTAPGAKPYFVWTMKKAK